MRTLLTALIMSSSLVWGLAPYWSISSGPAKASEDSSAVIDRYSILHLVADAGGAYENKREPVEIKGDYRSSTRWAMTSGVHFMGRYRLEGEVLIECGSVVLVHHGSDYKRAEESSKVKRSGSLMVNLGGDLCTFGKITPYSLVGIGYVVSYLEGRDPEVKGAYQWVTGIELGWDLPWTLFAQHRLHKPVRCEGTHSYEIGIRLKG